MSRTVRPTLEPALPSCWRPESRGVRSVPARSPAPARGSAHAAPTSGSPVRAGGSRALTRPSGPELGARLIERVSGARLRAPARRRTFRGTGWTFDRGAMVADPGDVVFAGTVTGEAAGARARSVAAVPPPLTIVCRPTP